MIMDRLVSVDESLIIIVLRLIPLIFGIFTVVLIFLIARSLIGSLYGWMAVLFLLILPTNYLKFTIVSHPDILQVFFVVLGLYFCYRLAADFRWKWLIGASAAAGLAFSCKYGGIFILPVIFIITVIHCIKIDSLNSAILKSQRFKKMTVVFIPVVGLLLILGGIFFTPDFTARLLSRDGCISSIHKILLLNKSRMLSQITGWFLILLAVSRIVVHKERFRQYVNNMQMIIFCTFISIGLFTLAFFVASPFLFLGFNFLTGILKEFQSKTTGINFIEAHSPITWISILFSSKLMGKELFFFALINFFGMIVMLIKYKSRKEFSFTSLMWCFIIIYMCFIMMKIRVVRTRYLFPVVPMFVLIGVQSIKDIVNFISEKINNKIFVICIVLIISALELPFAFMRTYRLRNRLVRRVEMSKSVEVGKWIENNFPPSTSILYDHFSYVPPFFKNVKGTWDATLDVLNNFRPDLVVVHVKSEEMFKDTTRIGNYLGGVDYFIDRHEYYRALENRSTCYRLVYENRDFKVFQKK